MRAWPARLAVRWAQPGPAQPAVAATSPEPALEPVTQNAAPELAAIDPIIEFETTSTELDDEAQQQIAALLPSARRASAIVIYGYSDRSNSGDAREIAIARALRVRTVLVRNDVSLKNIRIRYSTAQARHEAEVLFHENKLTVVDSLSPARKD
jgi:outer membrane protein OmpA-like peptidoglycan-associated protein